MPKVSVIIPTYNRAHLIGRAIQSVLDQTYQNFEIIVVDDASTDETEELVKSFSDNRINYVRHQKNKGGSAARNTGIRAAKGEFIAFFDSDDEWLVEKLKKQIDKFRMSSKKVGVIYCGHCIVGEETQEVVDEVIFSLRGNVFLNLLKMCITPGSSLVVRRYCFRKAGFFDEALPSCQDWDMWIRLSRYYEFDFIPEILVKYHLHGTRISTDLNARIQGIEAVLKKYRVNLSEYPSILSSHLHGLGRLHCIKGNRKMGRMYFWKVIELNPFHLRNYLHFLLSTLVPQIHRQVLLHSSKLPARIHFYLRAWRLFLSFLNNGKIR